MEKNDKLKTIVVSVVLSVLLSTALMYGVIMTVPQRQEALHGSQGEPGLQGDQGLQEPRFDEKTFGVNIGFDYGNGTVKRIDEKLGIQTLEFLDGDGRVKWFNDMRIEIGDGIMQATLQSVNAEYKLESNYEVEFCLTSLDGFKSGEGGRWVLWVYTRHDDWPDFWSKEMPDRWYEFDSLSLSIPLPDGFTCLWRWTTG